MSREVIIAKEGRAGRITLNRPEALHALNKTMCDEITNALLGWVRDSEVEFVLVDHSEGTRGFCAGGDVAMLAASGKSDAREAREFFWTEYQLNDLISRYPKPYIAVMDGVTMGGGVGISIHGSHQVATERTVFAMPETGIGLFPDVGGTWFLPRMEGELGTWLALTGARLKGSDVVAAGLASHYCTSSELSALKRELLKRGVDALKDYAVEVKFTLAEHLPEIDKHFAGSCAVNIIASLQNGSYWAKTQATKISAKSPLSTKITLRQLRTGAYLDDIRHALRLEYRIAYRLVQSREFHEGVRATLFDRHSLPRWKPAKIRGATLDMVAKYFAPLQNGELNFLEI